MSSTGVNKVILIGNLCDNPEVKFMPSGGAVLNASLATNSKWRDRETGERRERAEFHRLVFFNRLAEIVGEYLQKGSAVYVEGRLQTRKWQGQDGQDRYTTEIVVNEMQMLGGKSEGAQQQAPRQSAPAPHGSALHDKDPGDDFDDDIPF